MSTAGICLELADGSIAHIWLQHGFVLADEAALHAIFNFKGASGLKPCSQSSIVSWKGYCMAGLCTSLNL